jgi:hypothetical protein
MILWNTRNSDIAIRRVHNHALSPLKITLINSYYGTFSVPVPQKKEDFEVIMKTLISYA